VTLLAAFLGVMAVVSALMSLSIAFAKRHVRRNYNDDPHLQKRYLYTDRGDDRAIARNLYSILNHLSAKDKQDSIQEKNKSFRDWVTISAAIFAGGAAFASDIILWVQINDARKSSEESTAASDKQIQEMEKQAVAMQRAQLGWLAPRNFSIISIRAKNDGELFLNAAEVYVNVGHSPSPSISLGRSSRVWGVG